MTDHTDKTRYLNDLTRTRPETVNATWLMTRGVMALLAGDETGDMTAALPVERVAALRAALAAFCGTKATTLTANMISARSICLASACSSRSTIIIPTTTPTRPCRRISNSVAAS